MTELKLVLTLSDAVEMKYSDRNVFSELKFSSSDVMSDFAIAQIDTVTAIVK